MLIVFNAEKRKEHNRKYKKPDDKPSEIVTVFNHTRQLLLDEELFENYFLIFKQDTKVTIEIPMNTEAKDLNRKQSEQTSENNSLKKKKNFPKCTAAGSTAQGRRPATLSLEPADQDKT